MEYVTYILVILALIAVFHLLLRDPEKSLTGDASSKLSRKAQDRSHGKPAAGRDKASGSKPATPALKRESLSVPTPWGWPGHEKQSTGRLNGSSHTQEVRDVSESLHRFVDRLMSEKQTVENSDYLLKKDASLRALLEDRYGRVLKKPESENRKAKTPVSRNRREIAEVKTPWGW